MKVSFEEFAHQSKEQLEEALIHSVDRLRCPEILKEAMIYSLQAGGKRIRPLLLFSTMHAFGHDWRRGIPVAVGLEMIHTYSLIHDDLPCMDDDDLRRGKPTNHKIYGEAYAILAGDALLTFAFEVVASMDIPSDMKVALITELAQAAGPEGMVAGQVADMEGSGKDLTVKELEYVHRNKTGKLLAFAAVAGAILGNATKEQIEQIREFAMYVGLAFQIQDDILDVEGSEVLIGKPVGSDEENEKSTYVSLYSLEKAKEVLEETMNNGKHILASMSIDSMFLDEICDIVMKRNQ